MAFDGHSKAFKPAFCKIALGFGAAEGTVGFRDLLIGGTARITGRLIRFGPGY